MKIVLTAIAPGIEAPIDPRFGRSAYLLLVDTESLQWEAHPNPGAGASGGAGTLAAQFVVNNHASSVVSGDFGPNATNVFQAAGVAMYLFGANVSVRETIERFKAGELERVGTLTDQENHRREG